MLGLAWVLGMAVVEKPPPVSPEPVSPESPPSLSPSPSPAPSPSTPQPVLEPAGAPPTPPAGGGLTRAQIQRSVAPSMKDIKHCYELSLGPDPNLYGMLVMRWVIGGDGRVTRVWAERSSFVVDDVEVCVTAVIRPMVFPPPSAGGDVTVTYPFVFVAQGMSGSYIQVRGISAEVVGRILFAQAPSFDRCVAQRADPSASSASTLRLRVRPDGTVELAQNVGMKPPNPDVDACIEAVGRALVFPPMSAPATIAYPLLFLQPEPPSTSKPTSTSTSTSSARSCAGF